MNKKYILYKNKDLNFKKFKQFGGNNSLTNEDINELNKFFKKIYNAKQWKELITLYSPLYTNFNVDPSDQITEKFPTSFNKLSNLKNIDLLNSEPEEKSNNALTDINQIKNYNSLYLL